MNGSVLATRLYGDSPGRSAAAILAASAAARVRSCSATSFAVHADTATILRKRPAFRDAFAQFDPDVVTAFSDADVERLLGDVGIVRNRLKILATITNARATIALREDGGLVDCVWSFQPETTPAVGAEQPGRSSNRNFGELSNPPPRQPAADDCESSENPREALAQKVFQRTRQIHVPNMRHMPLSWNKHFRRRQAILQKTFAAAD